MCSRVSLKVMFYALACGRNLGGAGWDAGLVNVLAHVGKIGDEAAEFEAVEGG